VHEEPSEEIVGIEELVGGTRRPLVPIARHRSSSSSRSRDRGARNKYRASRSRPMLSPAVTVARLWAENPV
jgi:hypothetical protein